MLGSETSEIFFYEFILKIMLYSTSRTEPLMNMEVSTNYLLQSVVNKIMKWELLSTVCERFMQA